MRKIILFTLLLFGIVQKQYSFPYWVERIGVKDGLSNTYVMDIAQDKRGFIWFATEEGLNKLNGDKIITYFKGEENSITGNELNCVMDDPTDSLLWIGTQRAGLNVYDYANDRFSSYVWENGNKDGIITNDITDLCPSADGNIWIATYWGGVDYFDKQSGKFVHYNTGTMPALTSNKLWTVFDGNDGNLYLGHVDSGMSVISLKQRTVKNYKHDALNPNSLPGNEVNSIFKDSYGNLWIGTNNGLALFDSYNEKFINFSEIDARLRYYIHDIKQVGDKLWIATDFSGVIVMDVSRNISYYPEQVRFEVISNGTNNYTISSSSVRTLFVDNFSNLWFGLWGGGVNFINGGISHFNNYISLNNNGKKTLDNPNVLTVCCLDNNTIFAGTNSGNLSVIEGNRGVSNINVLGYNNTKVIQTSLRLSNGNVLLGLFGGGLMMYDRKNKMVKNLLENKYEQLDVRSIYEDNEGFIWLSTSSGVYKLENKEFTVLGHYDVGNNLIRGIVKDTCNNFFIATFGNGLFILDEKFNWIKTCDVSTGFTSNTINHLYIDSDNNIWVATGEGLVMFTPGKYGNYEVYSRESGLNNIHIRAVIEDDWNNIWISTNRGISCKKEGSRTFINYTECFNITEDGFCTGAVSKNTDGIIYFGSTEGICFFNPYSVLADCKAPEPFISSIVITEELDVQEEKRTFIYPVESQVVELDDSQNNFCISLNVMNYALKDMIEYAYMFKGFDTSWYTVDDPSNMVFRNIPYGEYELRIKSRIKNQEWGNEYVTQYIIINPPLWLTWWAKMIYFIILAIVIYVSLFFYKRRINLLYLYKMEKESHAKEQELNQERLRFYTNITHELRTPLTLIIGPLEDMIHSDTLVDKDKQRIGVIYKSALRLLNLINQILEFRRTETQNRKLCVSYSDLCNTVLEVGLKFKELNRNKEVDFRIETCCEHINMYYDKEIVIMVLDNLISNAFKYTTKGTILLSVNRKTVNDENFVEIKVSDTGYGISQEAIPFIFDRYYQEKGAHQASGTGIGLALVKKLIDLHQAHISIDSRVNEGSVFTILFKADYTYPNELHNDDSVVMLDNEDLEVVNTSDNNRKQEKPILLVIEDNDDIRSYVAESMSDDYDVRMANNGKMGLQIAFDVVPDIIVCDIMMPEMDGIEVCRTLKNNICTSHVPIILLTAKSSLQDKEEGYHAGADSYITKPFSASLLRTRIENIMEIRRKLSEKISGEYAMQEKRKIISESTTKLDNDFLHKFNELVEANLSSDKVDVAFLSDKLCMSNSTLYRKVKALTGLSTNEYVRKIKMQHAERLLMEMKYNISEIAFMVGMNSSVYFRQCFKEEFGMLPSDYLKKMKG